MRLKAVLPAVIVCLAWAIPPITSHAASGVSGLNGCPVYMGGDRICSGEVLSWDGSPLDVDLTLPTQVRGDRHPLIVMLHGFANNKHEWESVSDNADNADKWHWNNHWFAEHGFYVLTYTARGFLDQGTTRGDEPSTPSGAPNGSYTGPGTNGTVHLKSRDFEVKDTQWLAALVAAAYPDLDRNQIAVTGGSYGGGESWMQTSQPIWDANTFVSANPGLPVLKLQVAVPKYPWTDLAYSLAPNGHPGPFDGTIYTSSQGSPTSDAGDGEPLGVIKYSYAAGFLAEGIAAGFFETTPENVPAWFGRAVTVGDPYDLGAPGTDTDTVIRELRRGLTELRGSYYQDDSWAAQVGKREVAVFSVSGWTDDLFPPVESFRQFEYLKSLDRLWPVELAVADIGHPRAQNPPSEWHQLNDRAWTFLRQQIGGSHPQRTGVVSLPTVCSTTIGENDTNNSNVTGNQNGGGGESDSNQAAQQLTGRTPADLARGTLRVDYATPGTLTNRKPPPFPAVDLLDPDNLQTDPAFGSAVLHLPGCRQSVAPTAEPTARYTGYSSPLNKTRIYVGLGFVRVTYTLAGANTASLNARVWDVAPDGSALLVTRGTYRIDGNGTSAGYDPLPTGTIDLPLLGNQWTLSKNHRIRLDLTQVDYPTFLPSNSLGAIITFPSAQLVLPTREATRMTTPGA